MAEDKKKKKQGNAAAEEAADTVPPQQESAEALGVLGDEPTKANGGRTWSLPEHGPGKRELFKEYSGQDVVTEKAILRRLEMFPMPEEEERLWQMDVRMNAYGVRVDTSLIGGALSIHERSTAELIRKAASITGLSNPNSTAQLLGWLRGQGTELPDLRKETVSETLDNPESLPEEVKTVLEIRQQLGKTSIKKYEAMKTACCTHERARGLTQY